VWHLNAGEVSHTRQCVEHDERLDGGRQAAYRGDGISSLIRERSELQRTYLVSATTL